VHVDSDKIKDNTLVFKEGFLDSMGFIVLITFLEEEFKIKTCDSDLIEENFESINSITDFVIRKSDS
jgi:acyl carrier protein